MSAEPFRVAVRWGDEEARVYVFERQDVTLGDVPWADISVPSDAGLEAALWGQLAATGRHVRWVSLTDDVVSERGLDERWCCGQAYRLRRGTVEIELVVESLAYGDEVEWLRVERDEEESAAIAAGEGTHEVADVLCEAMLARDIAIGLTGISGALDGSVFLWLSHPGKMPWEETHVVGDSPSWALPSCLGVPPDFVLDAWRGEEETLCRRGGVQVLWLPCGGREGLLGVVALTLPAEGGGLGWRGAVMRWRRMRRWVSAWLQQERDRSLLAQVRQQREHLLALQRTHYRRKELVVVSPAMRALMARMERLLELPEPVLIHGERGVGKELLTRVLHHDRADAAGLLLYCRCDRVLEEVLERTIFGAAPGSASPESGLLELAAGGTLVLDEVSRLPAALQWKLERALQLGEYFPEGASASRPLRARVVATMTEDPQDALRSGELLPSLAALFARQTLEVPPLRARREDIPGLAEVLLEGLCRRYGRGLVRLTEDQLQRLCGALWPGNVRELQSVLELSVLRTPWSASGLDLLDV